MTAETNDLEQRADEAAAEIEQRSPDLEGQDTTPPAKHESIVVGSGTGEEPVKRPPTSTKPHLKPDGTHASPTCSCPTCKSRRSVRNDGSVLDVPSRKVIFGAGTVRRDRNGDLELVPVKDKPNASTEPTLTSTPERKMTRKERKLAKKTGQTPPPTPKPEPKKKKEKGPSRAEQKAAEAAARRKEIEEANAPIIAEMEKLAPQLDKARAKLEALLAGKTITAARTALEALEAKNAELAGKLQKGEEPKTNGNGSRGNTVTVAGAAPTEQNRFKALELAWQALGAKAASASAEDAWTKLGSLKIDDEAVRSWYAKADAQVKSGVRCQQQWCFSKELRARQKMTKAS